jgi:MoaA/NifB/PqqE/SkfB family radical SAM enzyme
MHGSSEPHLSLIWNQSAMAKSLTPPLVRLSWDVTNACNAKCVFCVNASGRPFPEELATESALRLIDEAADVGVRYLRVLGGEPFLRRDILQLLGAAASRKMQILISTNATLITPEIASGLKSLSRWLRYVQVSLYGASRDDYALLCGDETLFERAVNGIRVISAAGIRPTLFSVVTSAGQNRLSDLATLASRLGARALRLARAQPLGRAADNRTPSICISSHTFYDVLDRLLTQTQPDIPVEVTEYPLLADYLESRFNVRVVRLGCTAAVNEIHVSPTGDCSPCPFKKTYASESVLDPLPRYPQMSLGAIWHSPLFRGFGRLRMQPDATMKHAGCPYAMRHECEPCPFAERSCLQTIRELAVRPFGRG